MKFACVIQSLIHYVRSSSCSRKTDWHNFIKLTNIRADNVTYFLCTFMTLFPWIIWWKSCDEDWVLTENSRQWYILFHSFHHTNDAYLCNHFLTYPSDTYILSHFCSFKSFILFFLSNVSPGMHTGMYHLKCTPGMASSSSIWYIVSNEVFTEIIISDCTLKLVGFFGICDKLRWEVTKFFYW